MAQETLDTTKNVIAGLDPAIQREAASLQMDARVKPGHD
jgi:hypothetical protein